MNEKLLQGQYYLFIQNEGGMSGSSGMNVKLNTPNIVFIKKFKIQDVLEKNSNQ